jgi:hypothetical protein
MSVDGVMGGDKQTRELDEREADAALWTKCVAEHGPNITREFPMMVIPIATLLEMDELRPHESVKEHLVEWKPGMASVFFVSHTWLKWKAPDKSNVKIQLLKSLLKSIVDGSIKDIRTHYMADAYFGGQVLKGSSLAAALANGFVWMDIMSIPQADPVAQGKAINSIVSYVSDSAYFCVLAGAWRHENGTVRDVRGWHSRGWCRMEMLANALSPKSKPLIVAQTPSVIELHAPSGPTERSFMLYPVGRGNFTVDADKAKLAPVVASLISARKAYAAARGDTFWFRVMHASAAKLLEGLGAEEQGLAPPAEGLEQWFASMKFEGEPAAACVAPTDDGMTPLRYAAGLAGSVDLVREILAIAPSVDVEAPLPRPMVMFEGPEHFSILMHACKAHDKAELITALLDAGASAELPDHGVGCNALSYACLTGNCKVIDLLLEHGRTRELSSPGTFNRVMSALPVPYEGCKFTAGYMHNFHCLAEYGQLDAFEHCLATHPAEMEKAFRQTAVGSDAMSFGLTMTNWATIMIGNVDLIRLILQTAKAYGLDGVNGAPAVTDPIWMEGLTQLRGGWPHIPPEAKNSFLHMLYYAFSGTTALHQASYVANLGAVEVLLEFGAELDSQQHWCMMTPLMMCCVGGQFTIAIALLDAGASLTLADSNGKRAEDIASEYGHAELATQLKGWREGGYQPQTGAKPPADEASAICGCFPTKKRASSSKYKLSQVAPAAE